MDRPLKPCITCGTLTSGSYCEAHQQANNHYYNHRADRRQYRTTAYRNARLHRLRQYEQCWLDTAPTPCNGGLTTHHIDHDTTHNTPDNLAVICMHHHMLLEREYQAGKTDGPLHRILAESIRTTQKGNE